MFLVKKRLDLEEMIAEAGKAQLDVQKATTAEVAKRSRIRFQDPSKDVTQEFKGVAGTGFGFGRSQGFGQFYQPARQRRTQSPAAGGGAATQQAQEVAGAAASVADTTGAVNRLPAEYRRLTTALGELKTASLSASREIVEMTGSAVQTLAEMIAELRATVADLRADLEAAQQLGVAGE